MIVAALLIAVAGWLRADVVASVVVAFLILPRTWTLLRDAVDVLLEATPKNIDMARIRQHILETPGVIGTHDLHAWAITSGFLPVLSAHVVDHRRGTSRRRRRKGLGPPWRMPG